MRLLVGAIAALALAASAHAQEVLPFASLKQDSDAPIEISADSFFGDLNAKTGVYSGNVVISQGGMKLRADRVTIAVANGKPSRIEAHGNVVFDSESGTASGQVGTYDVPQRLVTLTGNVVLTKDQNVMRGATLEIRLASGEARLVSGPGSGRVQGLFTPPPQKDGKPGQ